MRSRNSLTLAALLLLVACGGAAESTTTVASPGATTTAGAATSTAGAEPTTTAAQSPTSDDPCSLATPETVAEAFGAASASGEAGVARNCHFTIDGGVAPSVEVFHYGSSASWDGVKQGYEDNRGGVTAVAVGEEAYQPNDVGPYEIVVRSGDVIFAVAVQQGLGGPEVEAAILDLAGAIAGG